MSRLRDRIKTRLQNGHHFVPEATTAPVTPPWGSIDRPASRIRGGSLVGTSTADALRIQLLAAAAAIPNDDLRDVRTVINMQFRILCSQASYLDNFQRASSSWIAYNRKNLLPALTLYQQAWGPYLFSQAETWAKCLASLNKLMEEAFSDLLEVTESGGSVVRQLVQDASLDARLIADLFKLRDDAYAKLVSDRARDCVCDLLRNRGKWTQQYPLLTDRETASLCHFIDQDENLRNDLSKFLRTGFAKSGVIAARIVHLNLKTADAMSNVKHKLEKVACHLVDLTRGQLPSFPELSIRLARPDLKIVDADPRRRTPTTTASRSPYNTPTFPEDEESTSARSKPAGMGFDSLVIKFPDDEN